MTDIEVIDVEEDSYDVSEQLSNVPEVAKHFLRKAKGTLGLIQRMLCSAPAFIDVVRASIPEQAFKAMLTEKQKEQLANGAVKLMTKKDGSLMAELVDPKTNRIVSKISLKQADFSPDITQALTNYSMQMQMAQIAEKIQEVQICIEEVRQGQENDRLATAYSCEQKLLQAMKIKNPQLKEMALLRIVSDAEDSRNLLMLSQDSNLAFIKKQPETIWGKFLSGTKPEVMDQHIRETRDSLLAVNMVSLVEAIAYQEIGEELAARQSLQYYADYLQKTYLEPEGLVQRLDLIDPSPESYWSNKLPQIKESINALPCVEEMPLLGGI